MDAPTLTARAGQAPEGRAGCAHGRGTVPPDQAVLDRFFVLDDADREVVSLAMSSSDWLRIRTSRRRRETGDVLRDLHRACGRLRDGPRHLVRRGCLLLQRTGDRELEGVDHRDDGTDLPDRGNRTGGLSPDCTLRLTCYAATAPVCPVASAASEATCEFATESSSAAALSVRAVSVTPLVVAAGRCGSLRWPVRCHSSRCGPSGRPVPSGRRRPLPGCCPVRARRRCGT